MPGATLGTSKSTFLPSCNETWSFMKMQLFADQTDAKSTKRELATCVITLYYNNKLSTVNSCLAISKYKSRMTEICLPYCLNNNVGHIQILRSDWGAWSLGICASAIASGRLPQSIHEHQLQNQLIVVSWCSLYNNLYRGMCTQFWHVTLTQGTLSWCPVRGDDWCEERMIWSVILTTVMALLLTRL